MTIIDLIKDPEPLEPETVREFFPELSSNDIAKIIATKVALQTNAPFEDMDVFENLVYVLNDIEPDVMKTEGCTPQMIWNAILNIKKIREDFEFAREVLLYIKHIFNDNGYYFYPEGVGLDGANRHLEEIKNKAASSEPLQENFIDIQVAKYKEITGNH